MRCLFHYCHVLSCLASDSQAQLDQERTAVQDYVIHPVLSLCRQNQPSCCPTCYYECSKYRYECVMKALCIFYVMSSCPVSLPSKSAFLLPYLLLWMLSVSLCLCYEALISLLPYRSVPVALPVLHAGSRRAYELLLYRLWLCYKAIM